MIQTCIKQCDSIPRVEKTELVSFFLRIFNSTRFAQGKNSIRVWKE